MNEPDDAYKERGSANHDLKNNHRPEEESTRTQARFWPTFY